MQLPSPEQPAHGGALPKIAYRDAPSRIRRNDWGAIFSVICAGFALISDGYQNSLMTMLNQLFTVKYGSEVYTSATKTRVSNALLVGEIIGQIFIGLTCDYMGRKWAIVTTTLMIVLGGIIVTAAHGTTTAGMFWMFTIGRGVAGFGAGGEYPASSTAASEAANETVQRRGTIFVLVTNLPLSFGGPFAISIFLIVLSAAGQDHLSTVWRVCAGLGCIWPLTVFYFRLKMSTSELYEKGAIKKRVPYGLVIKYYWKRLIGTCGAWFLYDFVTFPNGIFSSTIIASVIDDSTDLKKVAEWNLLLGAIALPGVFVGAFLCEKIGRKYTMMIGFSGYLIFGLIVGCAFDKIKKIVPLFIIFYGLMQSSGNLGPGDMLGLVSSESYATGVRGTCYGLSAAVGKAGAAIGTEVFTPIQTHAGQRWTFIIAAIVGVVGILVTFFFVPHLRDDDLALEDIKFANYLREHGYDGKIGAHAELSSDEEYAEQPSLGKASPSESQVVRSS